MKKLILIFGLFSLFSVAKANDKLVCKTSASVVDAGFVIEIQKQEHSKRKFKASVVKKSFFGKSQVFDGILKKRKRFSFNVKKFRFEKFYVFSDSKKQFVIVMKKSVVEIVKSEGRATKDPLKGLVCSVFK